MACAFMFPSLPMTFEQVCSHFRTVANAARVLGYTRQGIYRWKKFGIPHRNQLRIQEKTRGKLKAAK